MTAGENERKEASPPDGAGDGMNLLIGWRAGGEEEAGEPEPAHGTEGAAETAASEDGRRSTVPAQSNEPNTGAAAVPTPAPAATMADLAAGQRRILALLEELASKRATAATGDAGTDLEEAASAIQAATEWASDIRAAMDSLLVTAGKSIRDLNEVEKGLGGEVAALKTREQGFDKQIELLAGGARTLGTRLRQLDEARQKLDARSAELQADKQEIAKYYGEWTAAALAYRQQMAVLTNRLGEGENLVARVEKAIGPWTERIETSLDENVKAQELATALISGNVERLTTSGDAFLEKFGGVWNEALEGFRAEWRRTRRWSVPVLAAVLVLMLPTLPVVGALGQSELGIFAPYDDTGNWKRIVWEQQGEQVKQCLKEALGSSEPVTCTLEVKWK